MPLKVEQPSLRRAHATLSASFRLEQFYYLDTPSFPKQPTVEQCFSFMNIAFGGGCSVNNILFPNLTFRIDQGSTQVCTDTGGAGWRHADRSWPKISPSIGPVGQMLLPMA